jgi:hypothetical protein
MAARLLGAGAERENDVRRATQALKVGFNPFDCGIIYRCAIEGAT